MALRPVLDPELAAVVERALRRAANAGELEPPRGGGVDVVVAPEVRALVEDWLRDGGYDEAVAIVVVNDPELAIQ